MEEQETGNVIKTHVPDKGISEITLRNLERYDEASLLARTGFPKDPSQMPRSYNEQIENRFMGLDLMLKIQQHIITGNIMAHVEKNCFNSWKRRTRNEEEGKFEPFENEDNDINELKAILDFLDECEQKIETARKTKSRDDDFVWIKEKNGEELKELTPNFYNMFRELVESYRSIYSILLNNKIVTLGEVDNMDKTEEEKEEELMRRITEA